MVAVKDTGIGISEEGQKKLFARFRQVTPKTEQKFGGSGLGLAISRKLCHLHGGEIGVSAKEGAGSTFGFFFKVKKTNRPEDHDEVEKQEMAIRDAAHAEVLKQGNSDPHNAKNDEQPESLQHTIVERTSDLELNDGGTDSDGRYCQTKKIASEVPSEPADEYVEANRQQEFCEKGKEQTPKGEPESKQGASALSDAVHVLLVEDNIINQRIVARRLQAKGFTVTTVNNGEEAVDTIKHPPQSSEERKHVFDVILMDQEMPVMDGNAATKAIRELEAETKLEHIPIIGVSANTRLEQQDAMRDSGMDDVIAKPYKIDELVVRIRRYTTQVTTQR
nr:histidine protein kinase nik1 [Quercus suber]